jgi:hypothetical protein
MVEYVVNYDYISKVLCVNKAKAALDCKGKCHLTEELAKASEGEKTASDKKIAVKDLEWLFFQTIQQVKLSNTSTLQKPISKFNYCNLYSYLNSIPTFHPPPYFTQ